MTKRSEQDRKGPIERWIDEQIQFGIAGLTHPFEKRLVQLGKRIQKLEVRVRQISLRIDGAAGNDQGPEGPPGHH